MTEETKSSVDFRRLLIAGVVVICLGILALTALRDPVSSDAFWHLHAAKNLREHGLYPWHDHSSFTFAGAEVIPTPYLFQAGLYSLVKQVGVFPGFQIFKFFAMALVLGLALLFCLRTRPATWLTCFVLAMLVFLLQLRAMVRPELISYSLMVMAIMLYHAANSRPSNLQLLAITGLMWFWSNYHTPIIGYVIFAGFFLDFGLRLLKERAELNQWMRWLGWGVLVLMVGFANPKLHHTLMTMLEFSGEWESLISEYKSPLAYRNDYPIYLLFPIAALTVYLAFRQRRFGYLLVCAVVIYSALDYMRMVSTAGSSGGVRR